MQNENCFTEKTKAAIVVATIMMVLIGFVSCNVLKNSGQESVNENSDWYEMNLKGKVKALSWNYKDSEFISKGKSWFNEFGFIVKWEKVEFNGKFSSVDSINGFAEYKYDKAGNPTSCIRSQTQYISGDSSTVNIWKLLFDNKGNVIMEENVEHHYHIDYEEIDTMTRYYQYDNLNNWIYDSLVQNQNQKTIVKVRSFDKKHRLVFERNIMHQLENEVSYPTEYSEYRFSYKKNWKMGEYFQQDWIGHNIFITHINSKEKICRNKNDDVVERILIQNQRKDAKSHLQEKKQKILNTNTIKTIIGQ